MLMIYTIFSGRRATTRDQRDRQRGEQAALRAALLAELQALRRVYEFNEQLLAEGHTHLLPTRPHCGVFRANLNRLNGNLTPGEASTLVAAHAAADLLDAALQSVNAPRQPRAALDVPALLSACIVSARAAREAVQQATAATAVRKQFFFEKKNQKTFAYGWQHLRQNFSTFASRNS
jgi:hypothetical protein